jgi:hypothetical protein
MCRSLKTKKFSTEKMEEDEVAAEKLKMMVVRK